MGIKKTAKRLAKLGRTATRSLGKGGKKWVEAVFETAIGVIEDELRKKGAKPVKAKAASPELPPRRPASANGYNATRIFSARDTHRRSPGVSRGKKGELGAPFTPS